MHARSPARAYVRTYKQMHTNVRMRSLRRSHEALPFSEPRKAASDEVHDRSRRAQGSGAGVQVLHMSPKQCPYQKKVYVSGAHFTCTAIVSFPFLPTYLCRTLDSATFISIVENTGARNDLRKRFRRSTYAWTRGGECRFPTSSLTPCLTRVSPGIAQMFVS